MAYQLVYTSSPRGLKPGAFGFCVVACTRGMKEQTTSALEALSGYRRVYADPRDALRNPTSYSHVLFETATGRLRILARVADAGLDYSGRTNKIASFLDVATGELTPPGPAALFSSPGLFVTNWSSATPPQYYEAPISLPNYVSIPSGCDEWRNTTGDSAWAGVLASTVATRRPVALVVRPEQNVLRLFQESLALLPPGERWNATFSTYYMKTPPGVQCQWKAVMQGSPEELASRSTPGGLVLDLTAPNKLPSLASLATTPEAQALVAAARGVNSSVAVPTQLPERAFQAVPNPTTPPPAFDASPLPGAAPIGGTTPYDLASPVPSGAAPRRKTLNYGRDAILTVTPPPQRGNRETALLTKMLACVGAATILLGIVVAILWSSGVFEKFGDAIEEREKAVAEANGQPNVPTENTSEQKSPTESDATTPSSDESQESKPTKGKDSSESDSEATPTAAESDKTEDESPETTDSQTQKGASENGRDSEGKQNVSTNASETERRDVREDGDSETKHRPASSGKNKGKTSEAMASQTAQIRKKASENLQDSEDEKGALGETPDNEDGVSSVSTGDGKSEILNRVADNIETSLTKFIKEGGIDEFEEIGQTVKRYRSKKNDNNELKASIDHFDRIENALKFNSIKRLVWDSKKAKQDLATDEAVVLKESSLYQDLNNFFARFPAGVVRVTLHDENRDNLNNHLDIKAQDFKDIENRSDPSKMIELPLDGDEFSDEFYIDFSQKLGGIRFKNADSLRTWLLGGTIEVEAFANSEESALVFHAEETPLLDCSDQAVDFSATESLDLKWLFKKEPSNVPFSDHDGVGLFIEYVPNKDELFVVSDKEEVNSIGVKAPRAKNRCVVVLEYKKWAEGTLRVGPDFAFEIPFESTKNMIKQDGKIRLYQKTSGKWSKDEYDNIPDGIEERSLRFNVRYRASEDQKPEDSPIVGVVKVPLVLGR